MLVRMLKTVESEYGAARPGTMAVAGMVYHAIYSPSGGACVWVCGGTLPLDVRASDYEELTACGITDRVEGITVDLSPEP